MAIEQNKNQVRRVFEECINQRRLESLEACLAPTYVNHDLPGGTGPEGFRQIITMFLAAFPDMQIRLDDVIGEGDIVSTRGVMHGTHQGGFMGIPATGKAVNIDYIDLWRLENGRAVENWVRLDMMGLMQQLGVIPSPAPSVKA